MNFFKNIGTSSSPDFNSELSESGNIEKLGNVRVVDRPNQFAARANPVFVQLKDELVCLIGNINGNIRAFRNILTDGSDWEEFDYDLNDEYFGSNVTISAGDLDGDGKIEFIIGNQRGGISILKSKWVTKQKEVHNLTGIDLKPNPFRENIILEIEDESLLRNARFKLLDVLGREVMSRMIDTKYSKIKVPQSLANGIYYWQLTVQYGAYENGILLKQ